MPSRKSQRRAKTHQHRIGPILSVQQPLADLIMDGVKWCENRTWNTRHRGRLWIHASGRHPTLPTGVVLGYVNLTETIDVGDTPFREYDEMLLRACMRVRDLTDVTLHEAIYEHEIESDIGFDHVNPDVAVINWILERPKRLITPIPAKGKLRLWHHIFAAGANLRTKSTLRESYRIPMEG